MFQKVVGIGIGRLADHGLGDKLVAGALHDLISMLGHQRRGVLGRRGQPSEKAVDRVARATLRCCRMASLVHDLERLHSTVDVEREDGPVPRSR